MVHGADFAAAEVVRIAAAETTRGRIWNPPLQCRNQMLVIDPGALRRLPCSRLWRAMLAPTPSSRGRLFCYAAICTKKARLYLYKITTKFARSSGKTAKYASKTAACAKNTPIVPQSATIESTQNMGSLLTGVYCLKRRKANDKATQSPQAAPRYCTGSVWCCP